MKRKEKGRKKEARRREGEGEKKADGGRMEGEGGGNDVFRWGSHFSPVDWTDLAR